MSAFQMSVHALLGALLLVAAEVGAAPPPGHPSPDSAMQILQPIETPLVRSATVLSHQDANQYTYIEISENGERLWLAAPRTLLADGSTIRFSDGVLMRDFYSKVLQRSFPAIIFVRRVEAQTH